MKNPWGVEGGVLNSESRVAILRKSSNEATKSMPDLRVCEAVSGWKRGRS